MTETIGQPASYVSQTIAANSPLSYRLCVDLTSASTGCACCEIRHFSCAPGAHFGVEI